MNKFVVDGKVGVLIHPCYGAGWSTWSDKYGISLALDTRIINKFLEIKKKLKNNETNRKISCKEMKEFLDSIGYVDVYCEYIIDELSLSFVEEGNFIRIEEFDGKETLEIRHDIDGFIQV